MSTMNLRLEIDKRGEYVEYPYRVRAFYGREMIIEFEDDFSGDVTLDNLYEQIKRQMEEDDE